MGAPSSAMRSLTLTRCGDVYVPTRRRRALALGAGDVDGPQRQRLRVDPRAGEPGEHLGDGGVVGRRRPPGGVIRARGRLVHRGPGPPVAEELLRRGVGLERAQELERVVVGARLGRHAAAADPCCGGPAEATPPAGRRQST
ncbi:hypothetical protein VUR80DRAFT_8472 [Thermomyces stellatus]